MHPPSALPLRIRALSATELTLPVRWAAAEGWNPGLHDAAAFFAADPGGFLLGETAEGEPVSVVSAVRTGADFGFLGFYITAPAFRGRGHGVQLWRAAMARLEGRVIGLDGVVAEQAKYVRSGFKLEHRNLRYGGEVDIPAGTPRAEGVVETSAVPFSKLISYDAAHFGREREAFLRAWITLPESRSLVRVRDGRVCGFGVARRCGEGVKIGPLFAEGEADADALFIALAAFADGGTLFVDPPEPNDAAVALARRHGLAPVFETARMYRGPAPALPLANIYGITSFELG